MLEKLLIIYNKIWIENCFPALWSTAIVIPILKQEKNRFHTSSYRPIALTCVMCKMLEKIVSKRLLWILNKLELLYPNQCGFRRYHSTLTHLLDLQQSILTAFNQREYLISIFFDIEEAYDTAWKYGIIQKLTSNGINGRLVQFISNFLHNRSIRVRVGNTLSPPYETENGVPQGSVLSVGILFPTPH